MAKYLTLANGSLLVGINEYGHVRDLYYPYIGLENHISGASGSYTHRIGVWVDGVLAWLDTPSWKVSVEVVEGRVEGRTEAKNESLEVSLSIEDIVYNEKNVFLRKVSVTNHAGHARTIKVFFAHQFRISEDRNGSTGLYDPRVEGVIHYKGDVYFLIKGNAEGKSFDEYGIGLFDMESHVGTHIDAEDGTLSKNPIEHGSVDSVVGFTLQVSAREKKEIEYWIAAGKTMAEVHDVNAYVEKKKPEHLRRTARNYWRAWLQQSEVGKKVKGNENLSPKLIQLYEQSLAIIRAHMDHDGGIIASSDSDLLQRGRDNYAYVWPRDAAYAAYALDRAGYVDTSRKFFEFSVRVVDKEGYFMHKYRPDGALGSSWHPWIWRGKPALPIQEDETAIVLYTLWKHFRSAHDLEFIESIYTTLIAPAADFMCAYIDDETHLPKESYDLWEEVFGTSTYTSASVYGGLTAAAEFAKVLGKKRSESKYRTTAGKIKNALMTHLYNADLGIFYKFIRREENGFEKDTTPDLSGLRGLMFFGVLDVEDERMTRMFTAVEDSLRVSGDIGGYMRYAGDNYFRLSDQDPPNAWVVTTLWVAQYYTAKARTGADLEKVYAILGWVADRALPTFVLPEQVHPHSGVPISATPLVWSHAEYVITVHAYLEKKKCLR